MYELRDLYGKNLHFIGVGGVSMSKLAIYAKTFAKNVSGSDKMYNLRFPSLKVSKIDAYVGSNIAKITHSDYVIYSAAIPHDDIELSYAIGRGIPVLTRAEFLYMISMHFKYTIAIAGTHGKSSTTAILDNIFHVANASYLSHIGAEPVEPHAYNGGEDYFLTEACEYRRSFLALKPLIGVVLNVDFDHPDEYKDMADVANAFNDFHLSSRITIAKEGIFEDAITYGYTHTANYIITNVINKRGRYTFDIVHGSECVTINSPLYGKHSVENITAAYVIADNLGIDKDAILKGINTFQGLKRRYETKGTTKNGTTIISDYAHHPREIADAIATAHSMTHGRVHVVFEPHTYSRTKSLIDDFSECFYFSDSLILLPTYAAREREEDGYTTTDLIEKLKDARQYPLYFSRYSDAVNYIKNTAEKDDIVLVLGAGSVDDLANMLVDNSQ